jgi:hypothetical protein
MIHANEQRVLAVATRLELLCRLADAQLAAEELDLQTRFDMSHHVQARICCHSLIAAPQLFSQQQIQQTTL